VRLEKKRNAAWDERFDHIDAHFNREKRGIEEWLCVEAKKRKGEVLREVDRLAFDEEDMEVYEPDETDNGPPEAQESQAPSPQVLTPSASGSVEIAGVVHNSGERPRKRKADAAAAASPHSQKRTRREVVRYCVGLSTTPLHTPVYLRK